MDELAVFVIPYYADHPRAGAFLTDTVRSIRAQTDANWRLVIVDDHSPDPSARTLLASLAATDPARVHCIHMPQHVRQGICRNVGIRWAHSMGAAIILYNDSDDLSYPERLARVRAAFAADSDAGLVYSKFDVIDEHGVAARPDSLSAAIRQILDTQDSNAPRGYGVWKRIGIETGYATLTSTIAVRAAIALQFPFFGMTAEDCNAWYRMSGGGVKFCYIDTPLAQYRVPSYIRGSQDRHRIGDTYAVEKMSAEISGFFAAADMALSRGELDHTEARRLEKSFLVRLSRTLEAEGAADLARQLSQRAAAIDMLNRSS